MAGPSSICLSPPSPDLPLAFSVLFLIPPCWPCPPAQNHQPRTPPQTATNARAAALSRTGTDPNRDLRRVGSGASPGSDRRGPVYGLADGCTSPTTKSSGAVCALGTLHARRHLGHLHRRPANLSATRRLVRQAGQEKAILMPVSPRTLRKRVARPGHDHEGHIWGSALTFTH